MKVRLLNKSLNMYQHMHGSRTFCQRGSNFDNVFFFFFLADEGKGDPNATIYVSHHNFAAGVPMMDQH